eukprot:173120-Chlamydomonas_euryale.AAC.1
MAMSGMRSAAMMAAVATLMTFPPCPEATRENPRRGSACLPRRPRRWLLQAMEPVHPRVVNSG